MYLNFLMPARLNIVRAGFTTIDTINFYTNQMWLQLICINACISVVHSFHWSKHL